MSIKISLKFIPEGSINNKSVLFQVMAWRRQATSYYLNQCWPSFLTHICGTRGRWVNWCRLSYQINIHGNIKPNSLCVVGNWSIADWTRICQSYFIAKIILGIGLANGRRRYIVTSSHIGLAQNGLCNGTGQPRDCPIILSDRDWDFWSPMLKSFRLSLFDSEAVCINVTMTITGAPDSTIQYSQNLSFSLWPLSL